MALKFPNSAKYNFNKNLAKRYRLVPHLDRWLADNDLSGFKFEYEEKKGDDAWHPSGHCTPPPSELYYYATGGHKEPRDINVGLVKTFIVGHFWHQLLQHVVLELGFAAPDAIERKGKSVWGPQDTLPRDWKAPNGSTLHPPMHRPFHWATGSGDVAPLTLSDWEGVVDFKTMSAHQYKTNGIPDWAANKYEAQINIYMNWFDQERAIIVALNKDSPHDMKEFEFERNQPLIDAIFDKWEFVSECLDAGEAPTKLDDEMFDFEDLYTGPVAQ